MLSPGLVAAIKTPGMKVLFEFNALLNGCNHCTWSCVALLECLIKILILRFLHEIQEHAEHLKTLALYQVTFYSLLSFKEKHDWSAILQLLFVHFIIGYFDATSMLFYYVTCINKCAL